ncbi:MAG: hypothetical protein ABJH72_02385 [Reichenbachiella sp.]|uniref:hypothetical protein n=1 Tax=Reichenbachiella sp. TaxID=2184521 RepID=UPI003266223E
MKSIALVLWSLIACHSISSCTKKTPCPDFESFFLDYYPNGEEEVIFKNIANSNKIKVIIGKMRIDHVSAIKQNVINGKSTCYCWSKVSIGFNLIDSNLEYHITMPKSDGRTVDYMQIEIEDSNGFTHVDYSLADRAEIESVIETESLPFDNYLIFSNEDAGLVYEKEVGLVLIKFDNGDIWTKDELPDKRAFTWGNVHFEDFVNGC